MFRLFRRMTEPASESHMGIALSVAAVTLALMLWALLWQSNVIIYQRDLIRELWNASIGR